MSYVLHGNCTVGVRHRPLAWENVIFSYRKKLETTDERLLQAVKEKHDDERKLLVRDRLIRLCRRKDINNLLSTHTASVARSMERSSMDRYQFPALDVVRWEGFTVL